MKYVMSAILVLSVAVGICRAQYRQSLVSMETSMGYTTNTYLNPFFSEWDSSVESGYGVFTLSGQHFRYRNSHSLEATGALIVEPFLRHIETSMGGLATLQYRNRFSRRISGGVEGGISHFTGSFDRTSAWIQPSLTWFPGTFSSLRVKAGSNFRTYRNFTDTLRTGSTRRIDLYGVEFETWPSYKWQLNAGVYGPLETLPRIGESVSAALSVGYLLRAGTRIRLNAGYQQYGHQVSTEGGGPGFPPGGIPTGTQTETDRIFRLGLSADLPLNKRWSLFMTAERLDLHSSQTGDHTFDTHISGGFRFSFEPFRGSGDRISPEWETGREEQELKIRYRGEGRLYVTGDFNDWKRPGIPLTRISDHLFSVQLDLEPGAYEYKVLAVTGSTEEWVEISNDSYTVSDGFGGKNSLIVIE